MEKVKTIRSGSLRYLPRKLDEKLSCKSTPTRAFIGIWKYAVISWRNFLKRSWCLAC